MATARNEQPNGAGGAKTPVSSEEQTILQVRELLFGEAQRVNDKRQSDLAASIDALRADMMERLAMLESRMVEQDRDGERRHVEAVRAIGAAISDLGAHVGKLADTRRK